MRIWHYKILNYLPKKTLLAQWRELNSIFAKQDKHILINYIYEYDKENLLLYTQYVFRAMENKGMKIKSFTKFNEYFGDCGVSGRDVDKGVNPFPEHHTDRYLRQCYYNLEEKYDRGQKDFDNKTFEKLEEFVFGTNNDFVIKPISKMVFCSAGMVRFGKEHTNKILKRLGFFTPVYLDEFTEKKGDE